MPQISSPGFERLPLRVHDFLARVRLRDVWAIDLPRWRTGVTLHEFLRAISNHLFAPSALVRNLLGIRLFVGRLFGWDGEPTETGRETFAARLTDADRSRSLDLSPLEKLTLAARILAAEGHSAGLAGQITARANVTGQFLTLAIGTRFDEACAAAFIRIDDDLKVVDGNGVPNPATRFHLWIYRHRPDVQAIIHTHSPAVSALSMLGTPLVVAHMDMTMFQDNCAYLPDWPGLPIGDEEGRIIADQLQDKRSILLANHGLITTSTSIEEATYLAVYFERAAALRLAASAAGKIRPVDPVKAREAGDFLLKTPIVNATFAYLARRAQHGPTGPIGHSKARAG